MNNFLRKNLLPTICLAIAAILLLFDFYVVSAIRQSSLLDSFASQLDVDLTALQIRLKQEADESDLRNYFGTTRISASELKSIRSINPLIADVSLLDKNHFFLAETGDAFPAAKLRLPLIKAGESLTPQFLVTDEGFFAIQPVLDAEGIFTGSLVARLSVFSPLNDHCILLADAALNQKIIYPQNCLTDSETHRVQNELPLLARGKSNSEEVETGLRELKIDYRFLPGRNIALFRVSPIEPVYYHISFWLFISALLWFSVVLAIHFPGIIRKALREDKREQLEKLLQEQNKTLTTLENNLAEIQKSSASNPEDFEKIIEQIPEPDSLEEETAAEDTYEVNLDSPKDESESAEAKIIELKLVHTDFILLDPEENYSIKPKHANRPKLDDRTEKIRNRAFRPEVLNLLKDVQTSTPETADSITQRIIEFTNRWQKPEVNEWSVFLNEVYFDEVTTEEVENLLATLIDYVEADSAALLSNNLFLGCYETFVSIRMPEQSENLLYALSRDPHIFMSPERNLRTDVSKELKENLFFAKRFKPEFIQPLKEIYALPMISQGLDAYLLLFYNRVMPEHMMDVLTSTAFKRHLRELTPALKYFLQDHESSGPKDQTIEMLKGLREITGHARHDAYIIHLYTRLGVNHRVFHTLVRHLKPLLINPEKLFFNHPFHLIAYLSENQDQNRPNKIIETIAYFLPDVEARIQKFPELGRNYYSYI